VRLIEQMYRNRQALAEPWAFTGRHSDEAVAPKAAQDELLVRG
jgi:hypothetical protein